MQGPPPAPCRCAAGAGRAAAGAGVGAQPGQRGRLTCMAAAPRSRQRLAARCAPALTSAWGSPLRPLPSHLLPPRPCPSLRLPGTPPASGGRRPHLRGRFSFTAGGLPQSSLLTPGPHPHQTPRPIPLEEKPRREGRGWGRCPRTQPSPGLSLGFVGPVGRAASGSLGRGAGPGLQDRGAASPLPVGPRRQPQTAPGPQGGPVLWETVTAPGGGWGEAGTRGRSSAGQGTRRR